MQAHNNPHRTALLLKGAASVAGVLGLVICIWLADKAIRFPSATASQLGHTAPLWLPMLVFIAAGSAAVTYLFLGAARRVRTGEKRVHDPYGRM
jgi:hypothetical protein